MVLRDVVVRDNRAGAGGGIAVQKPARLTLERVAVVDNQALGDTSFSNGGSILVSGGSSSATLTNVTVSGNQAAGSGGGMRAEGFLQLVHVTITDNAASGAAGIWMRDNTSIISNTLIVANAGTNCDSTPGTLQSETSNVSTDASCGFVAASDYITSQAGIGTLQDNGGHTLTHALLAGSPAIDHADDSMCPPTDQRGVARPQSTGNAPQCDIGAYEVEAAPPTATPTSTGTSTPTSTATTTATSTAAATPTSTPKVPMFRQVLPAIRGG